MEEDERSKLDVERLTKVSDILLRRIEKAEKSDEDDLIIRLSDTLLRFERAKAYD